MTDEQLGSLLGAFANYYWSVPVSFAVNKIADWHPKVTAEQVGRVLQKSKKSIFWHHFCVIEEGLEEPELAVEHLVAIDYADYDLDNKEVCAMKREQDESIRNAFCTMMNKLAFAEKLILDAYIEDLREEGSRENTKAIRETEEKLNTLKAEKNRLSLLLSKGCGEPVSFRRKLMELDNRENALNGELLALQGDSPAICWTEKLKDALGAWRKDGSDPDTFFTEVCDSAVVMTGEYAEFNLFSPDSLFCRLKRTGTCGNMVIEKIYLFAGNHQRNAWKGW